MKKVKILVTGGAGFIGSHTVVELIQKGFEVLIADDFSNSHDEVIDAIGDITGTKPSYIRIDLNDIQLTRDLFTHFKPDAVVHFAAKKLVGESVEQPLLYYRNNIVALLNVMESALETGCHNLVFSSSCTVYGQPDKLPVDESSPLKKAQSPYGNTKKIAEDILFDVSKNDELKVISLRYFNPVGAHETALIGEYPLGSPSNLMPIITQTAIGKRSSFKIFGNDYDTPDGSCIRDYIHVTDVAKAHVVAIERLIKSSESNSFEVFNLGTGVGVSVFELVAAFEMENNIKLDYSISGRRPGDVEKVWADTTLANELLGWKASKGLTEMVTSAWEWEKKLQEKELKHVKH